MIHTITQLQRSRKVEVEEYLVQRYKSHEVVLHNFSDYHGTAAWSYLKPVIGKKHEIAINFFMDRRYLFISGDSGEILLDAGHTRSLEAWNLCLLNDLHKSIMFDNLKYKASVKKWDKEKVKEWLIGILNKKDIDNEHEHTIWSIGRYVSQCAIEKEFEQLAYRELKSMLYKVDENFFEWVQDYKDILDYSDTLVELQYVIRRCYDHLKSIDSWFIGKQVNDTEDSDASFLNTTNSRFEEVRL